MFLERGHHYGIIGGNGVGKTTLMRKLAAGEVPGFPSHIKIEHVKPDFDALSEEITAGDFLKKSGASSAAVEEILKQLMFTEKLKNTIIGGFRLIDCVVCFVGVAHLFIFLL